MMPCLSASRGYRPSPSPTSTTTSSSSSSSTSTSNTINTSISCSGSDISGSLFVSRKKPRTRRKRPQQMYNEAAAALSAIYPKIFSPKHYGPHKKKIDSKAWKKIDPLRFKDEGASELLQQEVPTLIGRVREVDGTELLCNEGTPPELKCGVGADHKQLSRLIASDSDDPKSKSQSLSEAEVNDSRDNEYDFFLESNDGDIDGGIMSTIIGSDTNPQTEDGLGVFGLVHQGTEYSFHSSAAIRALRRTSDCMICPVFDYSFPRLKLSDNIMLEERNTRFFPSFDWLTRDDAQQRLKLKLNYEDVLSAWSDRGPLYTDEVQHPQIVPDDSYSHLMAASMNFDVVPDLGFWRNARNGFYGQVVDMSSAVLENGMIVGSGIREASVLRYKEKRRTRLFSKKIRYEVRKFNAERRPRMKGRFVRRLSNL